MSHYKAIVRKEYPSAWYNERARRVEVYTEGIVLGTGSEREAWLDAARRLSCGSARGYRYGCRCSACKAAWAKRLADWRAKSGKPQRTAAQVAAERRYEVKRKKARLIETMGSGIVNVRRNYADPIISTVAERRKNGRRSEKRKTIWSELDSRIAGLHRAES